ncbi:hypothetical protein [Metabacillus halosaccharovorans]|uniref:hypothetical protein n=1 Tax=Metabacillus halosaccharovorans TaxID=930124 RepID=UPI001C1FEFBD|nr:hypothetical protein [Metabacillus halosaccharovorans]MBU7594450.1 hypothetical protein [Metabacillus halosaccharovorans]
MVSNSPGRINVIFQHDEKKVHQLIDLTQLTALLGSDLIHIDEMLEPKRIDKKVWVRNINGVTLLIKLK